MIVNDGRSDPLPKSHYKKLAGTACHNNKRKDEFVTTMQGTSLSMILERIEPLLATKKIPTMFPLLGKEVRTRTSQMGNSDVAKNKRNQSQVPCFSAPS